MLRLVQTSGQQILLQQRGNLVITQPVVTVSISDMHTPIEMVTFVSLQLQVQQDTNSAQKENQINAARLPADPSAASSRFVFVSLYLHLSFKRVLHQCVE